jgi:site-specific recombinase XerD
MIEDMQLRGLAERTQQSYLAAVKGLATYYDKGPDEISEAEIRGYFLYLKNEKKVSASTQNQIVSALKFLYRNTLGRAVPELEVVKAERGRKLPVVLSREEVKQVLGCLRKPQYRVCLNTIYSPAAKRASCVPCPLRNSSAVSCNTFCPRALLKCAITACSPPVNATGSSRPEPYLGLMLPRSQQ